MILVDKLLSIFVQTIHNDLQLEHQKNRWPANLTIPFTIATMLWYLQQQLCHQNLCYQFFANDSDGSTGVGTEEFRSLVRHFQLYDSACTQMVAIADLALLLQDLGGEYSAQEMGWIAQELDREGCGLVELGDFVQWWCLDTTEETHHSVDGVSDLYDLEEVDEIPSIS